jgi:hypothetical protein
MRLIQSGLFNREYMMKISVIVLTMSLFSTSSAFAQNAPQPNIGSIGGATAVPVQSDTANTPSYGDTIAPKSRAQVRQELIQAQNDGQLAYLNKTLYAHH